MTTFTRGLEQVWAWISSLHLYCNYLEMIKGWFLIGQDFLGFYLIKKLKNVISGNPRSPKLQNGSIKDKIDSWIFP